MVHTMHTGTSTQNVYFLPVERYTTITAVHNIHSGAQHIHDTETFRLPDHQVAHKSDILLFHTYLIYKRPK